MKKSCLVRKIYQEKDKIVTLTVTVKSVGPAGCRTSMVSDQQGVGPVGCWTNMVSDQQGVGPTWCRTKEVTPTFTFCAHEKQYIVGFLSGGFRVSEISTETLIYGIFPDTISRDLVFANGGADAQWTILRGGDQANFRFCKF